MCSHAKNILRIYNADILEKMEGHWNITTLANFFNHKNSEARNGCKMRKIAIWSFAVLKRTQKTRRNTVEVVFFAKFGKIVLKFCTANIFVMNC